MLFHYVTNSMVVMDVVGSNNTQTIVVWYDNEDSLFLFDALIAIGLFGCGRYVWLKVNLLAIDNI